MKNQKENMGIVASLIIVACVIGVIVYILINRNKELDSNLFTDKITEENKIGNKTDEDSSTTDDQVNPTENTMDTNTKILSGFVPVAKTTKLEKIDLVVGSGEEVKAGATVSVHYIGAVAATGAIFQSSKDFGTKPVTFPLDGVIKGWTDGIPGMKVGGTRRLIIPADQAYGATPPPGSGIPANADLVFDVELIGIE